MISHLEKMEIGFDEARAAYNKAGKAAYAASRAYQKTGGTGAVLVAYEEARQRVSEAERAYYEAYGALACAREEYEAECNYNKTGGEVNGYSLYKYGRG